MYCDELRNSVQFLDLHESSLSEQWDGTRNGFKEFEEACIEKAIHAEGEPVLPAGYKLKECLAEGGMGRVFLVVNRKTRDCLAAKVVGSLDTLPSGRGSSASLNSATAAVGDQKLRADRLRSDLRREAMIHRRLKHSNIVRVYGIRNTQSFTYMFMELLPGGELFDRIPVNVGLHVQQMFTFYSQILDALDYLHNTAKVVHLDIKPENIMISKREKAKLVDFGWAVDLEKRSTFQGPVGTLTYAAPEVFGDASYAGPPCDLFSLGVTLLTAVTGQRFWSRANPRSDPAYRQWYRREGLHTGPFFGRLPADLTNFLTGALAHRPEQRLTIEGVRSHHWYRRGLARRLTPVSSAPINGTALAEARQGFHVAEDIPVPSSQPLTTSSAVQEVQQLGPLQPEQIHLSQPVDIESMILASQTVANGGRRPVDGADDRLNGFSMLRRMTRFFSALASMEHTTEVIRAVVVQRRQMTAEIRGPGNILVRVKHPDNLGAVFRVLVYPLAGSLMVDCRRVSGDGLLFHQSYAAIYADLLSMQAVDDRHAYLTFVLPGQSQTGDGDEAMPEGDVEADAGGQQERQLRERGDDSGEAVVRPKRAKVEVGEGSTAASIASGSFDTPSTFD